MSKQTELSKERVGTSIFATSFSATLLMIVVIMALMIITYRVESALNIDPIVIFTITNHMDGDFSFTLFNFHGQINLDWLYDIKSNFSFAEMIVPQSSKMMYQIVNNASDCVAKLLDEVIFMHAFR